MQLLCSSDLSLQNLFSSFGLWHNRDVYHPKEAFDISPYLMLISTKEELKILSHYAYLMLKQHCTVLAYCYNTRHVQKKTELLLK
jgi:hypothetical protein